MVKRKLGNTGFRYVVRVCIENQHTWYLTGDSIKPKRTRDILRARTFETCKEAETYTFLCRQNLASRIDCPFEILEIVETRVLSINPVMSKIESYYKHAQRW